MTEVNNRFQSPRDEFLYLIAREGWANQSNGAVEAATGWFARLSNSPEEMFEVGQAFEEEVQRLGKTALYGSQGQFMVVEHPETVTVVEYGEQDELIVDYNIRLATFEGEGGHE